MRKSTRTGRYQILAALSGAALVATGCGGTDDGDVTLSFANSYAPEHPHTACGIEAVSDKVADSDAGLTVETFPGSQLGNDDDRFASVMSGDVEMDVQGSSALAATYEPIGVLDTAYTFDGPDHLFEFFDSEAADELKSDFREQTGTRVLDVWYFGMRHFSANEPIREPADLEGLRMRFPDSPVYLENAEALGAEAEPVAFEEVYTGLQQGVIDGQENPIATVAAESFEEVQSHVSMTGHQTGSQLVVINEEHWQSLNSDQQDALQTAVQETRPENRQCIEDEEDEILDEWERTGDVEVVEDVDREAFQQLAADYFGENLGGRQHEMYELIREQAP
ncbi:tripartite ATP-independent transporter DctP family solute receptor [Lipingzhangella halophila]|uniref:Tripartite ATP-independent transporter DctP family solute receptor n=1 Tax=Lipingzhangella halophila TaxID=1783352 RepID=A0A7W7RGL1_9ACTN|nr:DctP family TRAP transporter solute-binding subunit [Lipingzhangella halophila]MBB4931585.1 tripartite ATP-independent transporter DctP family solute receptor [Lipingzhangella halophila]